MKQCINKDCCAFPPAGDSYCSDKCRLECGWTAEDIAALHETVKICPALDIPWQDPFRDDLREVVAQLQGMVLHLLNKDAGITNEPIVAKESLKENLVNIL